MEKERKESGAVTESVINCLNLLKDKANFAEGCKFGKPICHHTVSVAAFQVAQTNGDCWAILKSLDPADALRTDVFAQIANTSNDSKSCSLIFRKVGESRKNFPIKANDHLEKKIQDGALDKASARMKTPDDAWRIIYACAELGIKPPDKVEKFWVNS